MNRVKELVKSLKEHHVDIVTMVLGTASILVALIVENMFDVLLFSLLIIAVALRLWARYSH
ncbi:MAG: hypothetical protein QXI22_03735 [Sulfolobales archaeon]